MTTRPSRPWGLPALCSICGYARVSSADQDYALQEQALRAAGCEMIRAGELRDRMCLAELPS